MKIEELVGSLQTNELSLPPVKKVNEAWSVQREIFQKTEEGP
jgi:hypothetical protein